VLEFTGGYSNGSEMIREMDKLINLRPAVCLSDFRDLHINHKV